MDWSIPENQELKNPYLQELLKNTIVCGYTMKNKSVEHCQYFKHYEHEDGEFDRAERRKRYEKELQERLDKLED